jgi:hypothetical protein
MSRSIVEKSPEAVSPQSDEEFFVRYATVHTFLCPVCDRSPGKLDIARCPACGERLVLALGVVDAISRAWVALAAAVLAGAGLGCLTLIICSREGWPGKHGEPSLLQIALVYLIANIPLAIIVLITRRRFMRLGRRAQSVIAALGVTLTAAGFVLLFTQINP